MYPSPNSYYQYWIFTSEQVTIMGKSPCNQELMGARESFWFYYMNHTFDWGIKILDKIQYIPRLQQEVIIIERL